LSASVLAQRFGKAGRTLGGVAVLTFTAYALWTAAIVEKQIVLRKRLTRLDNAKAAFLVDSLAAQETVKLHNNELVETRRFDALLIAMQKLNVRSQLVGALLNAGQAAIFGTGLLISMLLAAQGFSRGQLSLGDVVAVNGLLLQLARPMDFMGYSVSEIRQSLIAIGLPSDCHLIAI
jgi:ABC-type transport system involved in Fe-S cluster assembly fused permease/ATPase subunit